MLSVSSFLKEFFWTCIMGIPRYYLSLNDSYATQLWVSIYEKSFESYSQLKKWLVFEKGEMSI